MRSSSFFLLVTAFLVVACGSDEVPPETPRVSAAPDLASANPAPGASAEPTVPSDAQRAADKALEPSAAAAIGAFFNVPSALTKDNKRLVFSSNRDGSPQLYLGDVDKKDAPPLALTKGPERVLWSDLSRDGKAVFFQRDHEGDEFFHIYRIGLDGAGLVDLTPNGKFRNQSPILARKRPDVLTYFRNTAADPSSELVVQSAAGGEPKVVYKDPGQASVAGISEDGVHVLVLHQASASNAWLSLVDANTGKSRRVYPAEGKIENVSQGDITPDGKIAFAATDAGADRSIVVAIDVGSGKVAATYVETAPKTAIITGVLASPTGDRVAVQIDAGTHTDVRILDTKKLTPVVSPKVPLGTVNPGQFSQDGKSLLLDVGAPDVPQDVFRVDLTTGAVTKLREDRRPTLDALDPVEASVVPIPAFDGLSIPTNVYLPKAAAARRRPVIVSVHGGPATSAHIGYSPFIRFYLAQGFAVVEPNLRGSTGFGRSYEMADNREKRGDVLKDLERVNAWTKQQSWCDPDRVVVLGGSYGGYVVLLALTRQPKLWRAGVDLFGFVDLTTMLKTTDPAIRAFQLDEYGDLDKDAALLRAWSPLADADKIVAPLFVYAGQNDSHVPRSESDAIVKAVRAHGLPVEYMVAPKEGHSLGAREVQIEYLTRVTRFLKDAMK